MAIYKNVAGQKIAVYAYDPTVGAGTDPSKTGNAANITARISKDGAANAATNDVNPTELDATNSKGVYIFDLTQAETNAEMIVLYPVSATANVLLDPIQIITVTATASDVAAIKTKTDQLAFTIANQVDSNALTGGGGGGLDAAGVRAAIGLAAPDLDDQIAALPAAILTELQETDEPIPVNVMYYNGGIINGNSIS